MKPFEPVPTYGGCKGFFWCPKPEETKANGDAGKKNGEKEKTDEKKNDNDDKKNGEEKNGDEKNGEPKNGVEPKTPLMQALKCKCPAYYERLQQRGDTLYGWAWGGFTGNFSSPQDRINFGPNFNWRSNDVRIDQLYIVWENPLELNGTANVGYRVDFYGGNQAPFLAANGLFSSFTGFDTTSGYGQEGPPSFRQLNRFGIDLPQFYLNAHIPNLITERGTDFLFGKFWSLIGYEVYPGPQTAFYSRSYEIVYGTPFTNTGILSTTHWTDTWDTTVGVVQGQDVFEDNNGRPSFIGNLVWNSCDKRCNWTTAWITGPEQPNNNVNYRTVVTSYLTINFGDRNQWKYISGGIIATENNAAVNPTTGAPQDAEWYGLSNYLFYTVSPKWILGTRVEWFRDDDGTRTAVTKRPGFAGNFYEITTGFTYKPYQNLRIRPEIRFDWFNGRAADGSASLPYNDLLDSRQTTAAIDIILEF